MRLLGAHDKLVRREVDAEDGYVVKSQGDGFMVAFADPAQAVRCAVAVQRALVLKGLGSEEVVEVSWS